MSEELALPPTAVIQACRPYFSTINIQDSMNIYVSVVMKKTQSLKIDRPIKKKWSRRRSGFVPRRYHCDIDLPSSMTSRSEYL
ncbi:hypothetical protein PGT21_020796 [Puccinia graminis f. sp. tritici]|uniref:Uncharacterized protein n=1 Tax=Puccinia graminis f. sp. tritici TaxID=56615 RepID=A0A5B0MRR6_PUCGR|nr:hypothetical protein PGT21_020796 [Puccinia graminis f. sp. tritici]